MGVAALAQRAVRGIVLAAGGQPSGRTTDWLRQ
jgi:hypothetical protein